MHSVVINSGHRPGTTKKRVVGRNACNNNGSATSGIAAVPTPSKPDSLFSGSVPSTTQGTATSTTSKRSPQSWYPSPIEANSFDSDVDFVHWQSSQTTNPALNNLLKEASSEDFGSGRLGTSSSRISPSWQHSPAKSSSLMSTTAVAGSSSARKSLSSGSGSSSNMAVDPNPATARLRIRRTASGSGSLSSLASRPQQHHNWPQKNAKTAGDDSKGIASPFTSSDPDQILEMMRGVSAMIDENMSSNTPISKTATKEKKKAKLVASTSATAVGRSWSSMDIDMEGRGRDESPLSRFEKKGKGKGRESDYVDESSTDADVSMADASIILDSHGPLTGLPLGMKTRRREMLPPPAPINKSKPMPLNLGPNPSSTLGSVRSGQVGHGGRSASGSTSIVAPSSATLLQEPMVVTEDDSKMTSKSKEPEIQLHPLLLEKDRLKVIKQSQEQPSPVPVGSVNGSIACSSARPDAPARAPLTRTASIPTMSQSIRSSQSPGPPLNASQSSRQGPPRLGMGVSRTAPLPSTPNAQTSKSGSSLSTKLTVASKADQKKALLKPFKPPSRVHLGVMSQGSQQSAGNSTCHGFWQRNVDHNYSNRSAYPSPSPGSDDGGKKENEEEEKEIERDLRRASSADDQVQVTRLSRRGQRSPPALPPTPESVSKGGSESEDQDGIKSKFKGIKDQEDMDGVEGGDPDSSFSDMAFDISIDALEETMRKYD